MTPLFFIMCARSGRLRPYLAPDAVLRGGRQEAIDGTCTCAPNHQNDRSRQQEEVILITLTLLCPSPVHKEPELMMDHCNRHNHVARDAKGCNPSEQAEDKTQSPDEFRGNGQKCEYGRDVQDSREEAHRAGETISTEPPEQLLGAVREKYYP